MSVKIPFDTFIIIFEDRVRGAVPVIQEDRVRGAVPILQDDRVSLTKEA